MLIEIERAVGQISAPEIRSMLVEAEQCVCQLHQDRMEILDENLRLRSAVVTMMPLMPASLRLHCLAPPQHEQLSLMLEPAS